ncbi:MAG: coenzyme F420-reducing hydrogenase subunit beta [Pelotomaculum sp. PtaU1.Bin065]|nr:MAG: coenzyme F420-reducing hydrogenase subunit beta [Pelotomaculum sp. PtaU1.Bin065]
MNMKPSNNVESAGIISSSLCTGCGTCAAVCPKKSIILKIDQKSGIYLPNIAKDKCNLCGICLSVCPGREIDLKNLNQIVFGQEANDPLLGSLIKCYAGCASDCHIRYSSSSGGIITALLAYALKERIIDGALVVRADERKPLEPYSFVARTIEEIICARTSRYCPIPVNNSLREILYSEGHYAVVGLPCHIAGVRKAEKANEKLKEKIILHFCLVCNHTPTFRATQYLLSKLNTGRAVKEIFYRGNGWPGAMTVRYQDGSERFVEHLDFKYWGFIFQRFFWPRRCFLCDDKSGELGDVSFMDPYLPEYNRSEKIGSTLFIVRSPFADDLINKAIEDGVIAGSEIGKERIKESQLLQEVRQRNRARRMLVKFFKQSIPLYSGRPKGKVKITDLFKAAFDYLLIRSGDYSFYAVDLCCYTWKAGKRVKSLFLRN